MVVKIGLFCAGGMSTSMLEKKMSEAGSKDMIGCTNKSTSRVRACKRTR